MGIVSDDDFKSELVNSSNKPETKPSVIVPEVVESPTKGRGKGNIEVPESLRKIIGETNQLDGRQSALELARSFGISPSSVSAYAHGATSTASYKEPEPEITNHIQNGKNRIARKARAKLFSALKHITDDKLEDAKPIDLANIAKNMSGIIKDMEPPIAPGVNDGSKGPQFIFYAPQLQKEESYDVIVLKET